MTTNAECGWCVDALLVQDIVAERYRYIVVWIETHPCILDDHKAELISLFTQGE
jgi:hypothetical protein